METQKIKMVVFDMAGTTVNEDNVVYKTVQKALSNAGYNYHLDQVLAQGAGKEKLQAIKSILEVYGNIKDDLIASKIYDDFIVLLREAYNNIEIFPQDNAIALFRALKENGILVVLNTGYNRETAQSLIDKLGWKLGEHYDALVTATDVSKNRPNPDMIWFAMKQFNILDAGTIAKVGDSMIDIEEGKNAGCSLSIGITTGAHTYDQLKSVNPEFIINNLIELLPIINAAV